MAPVDDTVTAQHKSQVTSHKPRPGQVTQARRRRRRRRRRIGVGPPRDPQVFIFVFNDTIEGPRSPVPGRLRRDSESLRLRLAGSGVPRREGALIGTVHDGGSRAAPAHGIRPLSASPQTARASTVGSSYVPPETGEQPSLSSGLSDAPWLNRRRPGSLYSIIEYE